MCQHYYITIILLSILLHPYTTCQVLNPPGGWANIWQMNPMHIKWYTWNKMDQSWCFYNASKSYTLLWIWWAYDKTDIARIHHHPCSCAPDAPGEWTISEILLIILGHTKRYDGTKIGPSNASTSVWSLARSPTRMDQDYYSTRIPTSMVLHA